MYGVEAYAFFLQAEDGIRDYKVTGVQTCALPILKEAGVDISSHRSKHVLQLVHVLGSVRRDIDAGLLHHRDRTRVHPVRLDARRVGFDRVALQLFRPPLGHLAAAGIARAEEQDSRFHAALEFVSPVAKRLNHRDTEHTENGTEVRGIAPLRFVAFSVLSVSCMFKTPSKRSTASRRVHVTTSVVRSHASTNP